ncbi:MAG: TonB-dependent receptor [Pseudomonadota bacterium]
MTKTTYTLAASATALAMAANNATAQEAAAADELQFETVTVTATKREENLQDVPLSVAAVDGETLALFGGAGDDIQFLSARVPSVIVESSFGRIFPRAYIRGLGNTDFDFNASQPVSFIYDEVVYENPVLKGFPVFDLERVEVLRGPQGTLFGRNTPAGIIKFDSVKPTDELDAYFKASFGRFDTVQLEGAVGGPVSDDLSVRFSGLHQRRDEFIENVVLGPTGDAGGYSEFAWRAQALYEPTDQFSWLLNVHGRHLDGGQVSFQANAFETGSNEPRPGFDRTVSFADAGADSFLDTDTIGVTSRAEIDLGPATVTYIFGYESAESLSRGDVDGGAGAVFLPTGSQPGVIPFSSETADGIDNLDQFSHEVRIANTEDSRFNWTVGFYVFDEDLTISSFSFDTLAGGVENGFALQSQSTDSWAVFGSASYELTDRLTVAGGVRYSDDQKDFVAERFQTPVPFTGAADSLGPIFVQVGDDEVSWDVSATYAATDAINYYARIARGFRAPSIQGRVLFGDVVTTADSERATSFEGGVKSFLFDNRVRANLSGFYYIIDDQQLTAIGGAGNFNQLLNADRGVGFGFEAELDVLISENLTLTSGVSYNNTEIDDPGLTSGVCAAPCTVLDEIDPVSGGAFIDGNPFPNAPEWIANVVLTYEHPFRSGNVFFTTDWAYRSSANIFLYESVEFESDGFVEGGLRAGYRQDNWELSAFGRNITGTVGTVSAIDFNNLTGIFNQPAFWGVEAVLSY